MKKLTRLGIAALSFILASTASDTSATTSNVPGTCSVVVREKAESEYNARKTAWELSEALESAYECNEVRVDEHSGDVNCYKNDQCLEKEIITDYGCLMDFGEHSRPSQQALDTCVHEICHKWQVSLDHEYNITDVESSGQCCQEENLFLSFADGSQRVYSFYSSEIADKALTAFQEFSTAYYKREMMKDL